MVHGTPRVCVSVSRLRLWQRTTPSHALCRLEMVVGTYYRIFAEHSYIWAGPLAAQCHAHWAAPEMHPRALD